MIPNDHDEQYKYKRYIHKKYIDVYEYISEESFKNRLFLASICGSIVKLVGYETNLFCGNCQITPRNGIHKNVLPRIITTEKYYLFM